MTPIHVPVLIVGGGPVGLTASIWLSRFGVRSMLVERHPGTAVHPKARGINAPHHGDVPAVRRRGRHPCSPVLARGALWPDRLDCARWRDDECWSTRAMAG
jgi:2-polyprenyl-6-methoxyphenol hydroxylase-like FAD-dependent oxidoreductase